jgi:signal transduction histidine kinase
MEKPVLSTLTTNPAMQGFYTCRGVVTFSDRAFDKDYIFVQQDDTPVLVNLESRAIRSQFKVGQDVDLGGALEPGKFISVITPLVVTKHGLHSMPVPIVQPLGLPDAGNREGKWNELEGVVHSVNANGTLSIVGKGGSAYLWLGQTPSNSLARYVDAKLSSRGVLLLTMLDEPVLLIPSRNFIDVEEEAPRNPYNIARRSIFNLLSDDKEPTLSHRVRVFGEVTYQDANSFFLQDTSGGIRVRNPGHFKLDIGETVEVLAFLMSNGSYSMLTEARVRPAKPVEHVQSKALDLSEALSSKQSGTLVNVSAVLLARKTNMMNQVLELQEQQRVFVATLATSQGGLPDLAPGSRLRITGVGDDQAAASPLAGGKASGAQLLTSLNILLRSPQDVVVLNGPPWWTWKKTATLVGALLTILVVTLLWVHLLHRRLERQRATQLAFSRQVLERLEDERRRIAVNLHDSLGQTLLLIKNHAILAIQRPPTEQVLGHRLDEISSATSQAIEEVRRITHGLRPYQLDRLGLTQAIRASVSRAAKTSTTLFASRVEDIDGLFNKDAEIHVYRIAQEAVTNVVKHSAATEAAVVIRKRAAVVTLSIRDNGRGFNLAESTSQSHDLGYGLSGIAERVRILGGTLEIDSKPGGGTNLTVEVPIPISKT